MECLKKKKKDIFIYLYIYIYFITVLNKNIERKKFKNL